MSLEFFNVLWLYFLEHCLFGFRIDTSNLPFSLVARFVPFYGVDFYIGSHINYDTEHGRLNRYTEFIIPFICDIMYVREV